MGFTGAQFFWTHCMAVLRASRSCAVNATRRMGASTLTLLAPPRGSRLGTARGNLCASLTDDDRPSHNFTRTEGRPAESTWNP